MGLMNDRVVVVTGASRGVGKAVALALAPGAVVYVTGRTDRDDPNRPDLPGSVTTTAREIDVRGGIGIPVVCDHANHDDVRALFERIAAEHGHLDILVNNAAAIARKEPGRAGFWEQPLDLLDQLEVGLTSHYVAAYHAAPLMVAQRHGLIVNTSSPAGRVFVASPLQGAQKAGADKMAHDMAVELADHNVAVVSLWLGLVMTERAERRIQADATEASTWYRNAETGEFTGRVIDALASDPDLMSKTGRVFWGAELAVEYGVRDVDGTVPVSNRDWLGPPTEYGDAEVLRFDRSSDLESGAGKGNQPITGGPR